MLSITRNSCNSTVGCVQGLFLTQSTHILAKTTQFSCTTQELILAMICSTSTLSHSVVPAERKLRGSLMVNGLMVLYMITSGQNMWSHLVLCAACLGVIRRGAYQKSRERNMVALVKEVVNLLQIASFVMHHHHGNQSLPFVFYHQSQSLSIIYNVAYAVAS